MKFESDQDVKSQMKRKLFSFPYGLCEQWDSVFCMGSPDFCSRPKLPE